MEETQKQFGLSRKTNIVIACVASIAAVQQNLYAVIAAAIVALVGITYQYHLDKIALRIHKKAVQGNGP